jgi:carbon monoxide dehydrogenase subunit G
MELTNDFRVGVSVPEAWKVLTDVERIAPLLPGAQLQEVEGDEYRGVVKVKVGPITAEYKGRATFEERDEDAGRVVLKASGRDSRGQGNASALITATMIPDGDGTKVSVVTDLTITGKVAQFGRGVLAEVSSKMIGQFVGALEADIASSGQSAEPSEVTGNGAGPAAADQATDGETTTGSGVRRISSPEAQPVDLMSVAGGSALKRLIPLVAVLATIIVVLARRRAQRAQREAAIGARLTSHLPSVSDLTGHLPDIGDLAGRLPDLRRQPH